MNIQHLHIVFSEKKFSTIVSRPISIAFAMYAFLNRIKKKTCIFQKRAVSLPLVLAGNVCITLTIRYFKVKD